VGPAGPLTPYGDVVLRTTQREERQERLRERERERERERKPPRRQGRQEDGDGSRSPLTLGVLAAWRLSPLLAISEHVHVQVDDEGYA
jgi:hypothetical protein